MNPTLVLCALATPLSFILAFGLAWVGQPLLAIVPVLTGVAPLTVALWQIVKFTQTDPDRLHHERHVENKMIIGQQITVRDGGVMKDIPLSLTPELTLNPASKDQDGV